MITYSNLKAYNQIWSPMGRYPMIDNTIFETYTEALAFATTNSVAVVGNIITVTSDDDSSKNGAYVLVCDGKLTNASQPTGLKKLGSDIDLSNYVTKDQISSVYTYKGSKDTFAELPVVNTIGDVWNVNENHENHPAGTNWVWNGTAWDALAGAVDLSGYALKADVEASVKTLTDGVAANTGAIATINSALDNKVEKVDGSSLISEDKLALIDTNAQDIQALENQNLDSRVSALEGMFKDGDTNIDLSSITASITDHTSRIGVLEGDNTNNKTNISNLQTEVSGHAGRLTAIETLNTEQSNLISGLTLRVEAVEAHGSAISNLTGLVNGHTESISALNTGVNEAKTLATSEASKALENAKSYADNLVIDSEGNSRFDVVGTASGFNDAMNIRVAKLEAIDHDKLASDAAASAVATVLDGAPEAFDTLKEVAEWIGNNQHASDVASLLIDVAALKAIDHDAYIQADTALETSLKGYVDTKVGTLGTAASKNVEYFATAAQGALAETAAQQANTYTKAEVNSAIENAFTWIIVEDDIKE